LVSAMLLCMANVSAQGGTTGTLTWNINDGTLTISGEGAMPDYSKEYFSIPWYSYQNSITSVVIKDGVTTIGDYAFLECNVLASVIIPKTVTRIGNNAFRYCENLISIDIPESVTNIDGSAFYGSGIVSITIPNGVTSIEYGTFNNCVNLSSIHLCNSITTIAEVAFFGCHSLTSILIPDGVTSIGTSAFSVCWNLTSITLPSSVKTIEIASFISCYNLTTITNFNPVPIAISSTVFDGVDKKNCTLKVPMNAVDAYKNAEVWKEFKIVEIEESLTSITSIETSDIKIYPNPTTGKVYLKTESVIKVYNLQGVLLQETFGKEVDLSAYPQGVYLMQINDRRAKVIKQ